MPFGSFVHLDNFTFLFRRYVMSNTFTQRHQAHVLNRNTSPYLRAQIVIPKLSGIDHFKTKEHRLAFEQLLGEIWRDLIKRLQDPIKVNDYQKSRQVEVLGLLRYHVSLKNQKVICKINQGVFQEDGWHFSFNKTQYVMVDPPLICNKALIGEFVNLWNKEIDHLADLYAAECGIVLNFEAIDCVDVIKKEFIHSIHHAVHLSTNWKQLRHDVYKSLALDEELVHYSRLSRVPLKKQNLSEHHFNHVCRNRDAYRQIHHDAPNLLWLYKIARSEKVIKRVSDNPVLDLKNALLKDGASQRAWRILSKSKQKHFDEVIKANYNRWCYLLEYLQLHDCLDLTSAIPHNVYYLLNNPHWKIAKDNRYVTYRGAEVKPKLFKLMIEEFVKRQSVGEVKVLEETEVSKVLTWIAQNNLNFDANQQKQPWSWYVGKANDWFAEQLAFDELKSLSWDCNLKEADYLGFRFTPINNAWDLRVEAIKQRHCADVYIERCINGFSQMIRIQDLKNKSFYTLSLECSTEWQLDELKGFANRDAPEKLWEACQQVIENLNNIKKQTDQMVAETKEMKKLRNKRYSMISVIHGAPNFDKIKLQREYFLQHAVCYLTGLKKSLAS
jgi:hypothetical protein